MTRTFLEWCRQTDAKGPLGLHYLRKPCNVGYGDRDVHACILGLKLLEIHVQPVCWVCLAFFVPDHQLFLSGS